MTLLPIKGCCGVQAQRKAGVSPDADTDMAATTSTEALQQSAEDRAEAFSLGKRDRTAEASTSAGTPMKAHLQPCTKEATRVLRSCAGTLSRTFLHKATQGVLKLRLCRSWVVAGPLHSFQACHPTILSGAEPTTAAAEGSRKAFFKDFRHVVQEADIILEVLDARDPLASRCLDIERHIRRAGAAKKIVLILNKIGVAQTVAPAQCQHHLCTTHHKGLWTVSLSMRAGCFDESCRRHQAGSRFLMPLGEQPRRCLSAPAQLAAESFMSAPSCPHAVHALSCRRSAQTWSPRRWLSAG